ncbi:MAG: hypothetical protein PHN19_05040 [Patescibacteria group bacterium]|nr:hypothetical protein [Patescibacteria group bacterium]
MIGEIEYKEASLINEAASLEIDKCSKREQSLYETLQNLRDLKPSFADWQFFIDDVKTKFDKWAAGAFSAVAIGEMMRLATGFDEYLAVYKMAKPESKYSKEALSKMQEMAKADQEKEQLDYILHRPRRRK